MNESRVSHTDLANKNAILDRFEPLCIVNLNLMSTSSHELIEYRNSKTKVANKEISVHQSNFQQRQTKWVHKLSGKKLVSGVVSGVK